MSASARPASATRRIAYNTAVQALGRFVVMFLGLVSVAILTRYLGADGYGKFTLALVYLSFFGIAADMGLYTIAVREMSKKESRMQEIVANTLSLRALLATVVFTLAIGIGWLLPYEPDVKVAIAIAAGAQFFGLLNSAVIAVFQTKLRMGFSVISDLAGRTLALLAVIAVAYLNLGFYAVVATAALGSFLTFLVSTFLVRRFVRVRLHADVALWKELLKESVPYGAALVVIHLYLRADIFLLSLLRSNAEVGVYGVIFKIFELVIAIPAFFNNSVFPVLVRRLKRGAQDTSAIMQKALDALLAGGAGIAVGGIVLAPEIMRVIGGSEFVSGADALRLILLATVLSFTLFVFASLYIALGRQAVVLKIAGSGLVLNVALNLLLIPPYGINGAALATLVSEAFVFSVYLLSSRKLLGLRVSFGQVPRIALAAALMALVIWPLHTMVWVAVPVGAVVYGALLYALRVITRDVITELKPGR